MSPRSTDALGQWLVANLNSSGVVNCKFVGGSNWASTYLYTAADTKKYFIKTALSKDAEAMFKGEALGLHAMYGEDPMAAKGFYGFEVDNTIGATPQPNDWMDNWVDFFRERRLRHQLRLAGDGRLSRLGEKLCDNLDKLFEGVEVKPSLLHGDLWSGNFGSVQGQPAIYDPATYYGHHEAEFGMSWCAGFNADFWRGYHEVIPRAPGFEERHKLYTLYHYLNHYNLFGGGYYGECSSILEALTRRL